MANRYEIVRWGPAPEKIPEPQTPVELPKPTYPDTPEILEQSIISQIRSDIWSQKNNNGYGNSSLKSDMEILLDSDNGAIRMLIKSLSKILQAEIYKQYNETYMFVTALEKKLNDIQS